MAHTQIMFQETKLVIPDFVSPLDIDTIHKWFETFNIAKVENVEFFEHEEPEYYVEDTKNFYGYAVIYIQEWYDNQGSRNFYQDIVNCDCKMIYDDPCYWTLEFYDYSLYEQVFTTPTIMHNNTPCDCEENEEIQENEKNDESKENIIINIKNKISSYFNDKKENQEEQKVKEEVKELDDDKYEDGIYQESDEENDFENKYYYRVNKKLSKSKKNKSKDLCETDVNANDSDNSGDNDTQDKDNNKMLKSLVKKNRTNAKRKKEKALRNIWSRRLRVKLE